MPWTVRDDHPDCDGFAVVPSDEPDAEPLGCHDTREEALDQVVALYEAETEGDDPPADPPAEDMPPPPAAGVAWRGVLALADTRTEDGRSYTQLGVREGNLPLALQDDAQHDMMPSGGDVCGTIDRTLQVGRVILGWGTYHDTEAGARAGQLARDQARFGVSVDLADLDQDVTYECRAEGTVHDPWFDEDLQACVDMLVVFPFARIAGATMTPVPAFGQAWIELASASELDDDAWGEQVAAEAEASAAAAEADRVGRMEDRGHTVVVASAVPAVPDLDAFYVPEPDGVQVLAWTPDGRLTGHLAAWGECHISYPGCVEPSPSPSGYSAFHTGSVPVTTPDGPSTVRAGQITFHAEHADERLTSRAAVAHYENTALVAADVRAIDGVHGIWLSGALRSGFSDEKLREIMAAAPSGDWRWMGDGMELVSVHQVNTPGFMGPHRSTARAVTAGGHPRTLIRLAHGFPRQRGQQADKVARLGREVADLRAIVTDLWENGGRDLVIDRLSLANRPRPAPATAAAKPCGCKAKAVTAGATGCTCH